MTYASGFDSIAELETRLMEIDESVEEIDSRKRHIENELRMQIELKAEDKASGLTNEKKRQIAYEELADCNEELQGLLIQLRNKRREQKRLGIEVRNEQRAFQMKLIEAKT